MLEWLLTSVDAERAHVVTSGISFHGRIMTVAWGFIVPLAILMARFAKILPWQKWPRQLDNQTWWHSHWVAQTVAVFLTFLGVGIVYFDSGNSGSYTLHRVLGYAIMVLGMLQLLSGLFRGTKGGPSDPAKDGSLDGDHYNMTKWRLHFEKVHKSVGYFTLTLTFLTIPSGMWAANAPNWMFVMLFIWWSVLIIAFVFLQRFGYAVETYQAVWGPDPKHPGNQKPPVGWSVRRPSDDLQMKAGE